jgi:hypothetical protein
MPAQIGRGFLAIEMPALEQAIGPTATRFASAPSYFYANETGPPSRKRFLTFSGPGCYPPGRGHC